MSSLRALALATGLLCLAATGASAQAFRPVSDPDRVVQGFGFTVLPPSGDNWYVAIDSGSAAVAFGKKDPEHARQRGSVILTVALVRAQNDIATPDALRAEVEQAVRASSGRFKTVSLTVEPYVDADKSTDCVRIISTSEERDNPSRPGETLLMVVNSKACRHPLAPAYFVQVGLSERRPARGNSLVDDKLKAETERAMGSVAFAGVR